MKTPLKSYKKRFKSASVLKKIIPAGSVVESLLFFSGELEFNLVRAGRCIRAHTDRYYVSEFWSCVSEDAERLHQIIASEKFEPSNNEIFNILQENWTNYRDPFIRAALFFILNNSTDTGLISVGNIAYNKHSPFALSALKNFSMSDMFQLKFDASFDESLDIRYNADFLLIPVGKYTHNFLSSPRTAGYEMTPVDHNSLFEKLKHNKNKCVVVYNYHPSVLSSLGQHRIIMVNNSGQITEDTKRCEELIVTNF